LPTLPFAVSVDVAIPHMSVASVPNVVKLRLPYAQIIPGRELIIEPMELEAVLVLAFTRVTTELDALLMTLFVLLLTAVVTALVCVFVFVFTVEAILVLAVVTVTARLEDAFCTSV
jgi:hypothetical protein